MDDFSGAASALFPIMFVILWLVTTTVIGIISGWFQLMRAFPDRADAEGVCRRFQTGTMNMGVTFSGILSLRAGPAGLRVGMMRLFGPFNRSFFVPWRDIHVSRKTQLFSKKAELRFGDAGKLVLAEHVANWIARAAGRDWPETGTFPPETNREAAFRVMKFWVAMTALSVLLLFIAFAVMVPDADLPPFAAIISIPAGFFGVAAIATYLLRPKA